MEITNITITNIKRYGTANNSLDVSLKSNKYNLLVAPNGFGKSSLAKALESLTPKGIVLKKDLFYKCDETLNPEIEIIVDGHAYTADSNHNDISPMVEPFVINSGLYPAGSARRFGNNIYNPKGNMKVEDIIIRRLIPEKSNLKYSYSNEKSNFGAHGSLLINLTSFFNDNRFLAQLIELFGYLDAYTTNSCIHRDKLYGDIRTFIHGLNSSRGRLLEQIPDNLFDDIEGEGNYSAIISMLRSYGITTHLDEYTAFYQIRHIYGRNKVAFKKLCYRAVFELEKQKLQNIIESLESPAFPIALVENKRELVVTFPDAENISNGQRDLMSLVANLLRFEAIIDPHKNYFLIIDEVFDYLDDANFIAVQYYLSRILKGRSNVIITILTHLDPRYFRMSTVFSPKKLNVQFMMNIPNRAENTLKQLVVFRQGLDHQSMLYKDISTYLFHYSPLAKDFSGYQVFNPDLESLNSTDKLKNYVASELSKYLNGQTFDPIAVCLGIRYKSEKDVYESIEVDKRATFLSQKGTRKRLAFAENLLGDIDDKYYILSVLHNEINHLSDVNEEKVCIYQLENLTIKQMILSLFGKKNINSLDI